MVDPDELVALAGELILVLRCDATLWLQEQLASDPTPAAFSLVLEVL